MSGSKGPEPASPAAAIDRPIFVIGMPRSGTTLVYQGFALHRNLGWFSYRFDRFPRFPQLSALGRLCDLSPFFRKAVQPSGESRGWLERLRDGPAEAYGVWATYCGDRFRYDYLLGQRATATERRAMRQVVRDVLRYQGKQRFVSKLTGPARMGYLLSLFPDARFVHVIRDGRAVVRSLMNVDFWRDTWRMREPAWRGGLPDGYLRAWQERDRSPLALAALQWRNVIERAREEETLFHPDFYREIRYEDFLAEPLATLEELWAASALPPCDRARQFLGRRLRPRREAPGFRRAFSSADLALLNELLADLLRDLGYEL